MDQDMLTYVLGTVVVLLAAYIYVFPSFPDVAPAVLQNQTSIAPIRKPGQTAIYRSNVVSHGNPLISGLSVESGKYSTRDGTIGDLWELAKDAKIGAASLQDGTYGTRMLDKAELTRLMATVGGSLTKWCKNGQSVAVLLPNCLEAFVTTLSAALHNTPVVIVPFQGLSDEQLQQALDLANPGVIVSTGSVLKELTYKAVYLATDDDESDSKWHTWSGLQNNASKDLNIPDHSEQDTVISLAYVGFDQHVQIINYTSQNLVSAIAAQIKCLPLSDQWAAEDVILSCNSSLCMYGLVLSFVSIVQGSTLYFPLSVDRSLIKLIGDLKPSIVVSDDRNAFQFIDLAEQKHYGLSLRLQMGLASLSRGILPKSPAMQQFKSVRLIYSAHDSLEFKGISNEQCNWIRGLTGAKLIHSFTSPMSASAIAQTHPSDYRVGDPMYINYGAPLPCSEVVLRDHGPYTCEDKKGQIWVRGHSLPTKVEWANTGIIGIWETDGALKLFY